ncbi:MAG TPA: hypothetical protein V6C97_16940, partial [Oculatellaceae cyanobacterium]
HSASSVREPHSRNIERFSMPTNFSDIKRDDNAANVSGEEQKDTGTSGKSPPISIESISQRGESWTVHRNEIQRIGRPLLRGHSSQSVGSPCHFAHRGQITSPARANPAPPRENVSTSPILLHSAGQSQSARSADNMLHKLNFRRNLLNVKIRRNVNLRHRDNPATPLRKSDAAQ